VIGAGPGPGEPPDPDTGPGAAPDLVGGDDEVELEGDAGGDDDDEAALALAPGGAGIAAGVRTLTVRAGGRLDAVVTAALAELTRAAVQRLIGEGRVRVDGLVAAKAGLKLRGGERVEVDVPAPVAVTLEAEAIPLVVLYEDEHVIAVDKPAGLVVHPAPGHPRGTLVNALLHHCRDLAGIGGELRPGIVHRLDKDTSGVLIASKHDHAHIALVEAFKHKATMVRSYLALCAPPPYRDALTLRTLYGRHPVHRMRFSSKVERGKSAVTHVRLLARAGAGDDRAARISCQLETGRTHQIRVHCADHGFAIVGDPVYGPRPRTPRLLEVAGELGRQALHAERLELDHPITGVRLRLHAPAPADLERAWSRLSEG
jgi:23S rRNA pseudouridine1911/1915/1917 synthase